MKAVHPIRTSPTGSGSALTPVTTGRGVRVPVPFSQLMEHEYA